MNHNNSDYQPMHIRNINDNTLQKLNMLLNAESRNKVLIENDTNNVYSISSEHYLELYDTCTKITNTCKNRRNTKPWLTKGLLNACRKKDYLYKQFINNKTKMNEIKHKKSKNNLVNILRNHK